MSKKLFNILLASLAVLLFSQELTAKTPNSLTLTLVKDLQKFKAIKPDNPEYLWQPLELIKDKGFVLGDENNGGRIISSDQLPVYYPNVNDESVVTSFPQETNITYVELGFRENVNGGKAVLVAGGIGQNFVSLVVEVPKSYNFERLYANVYGFDVE